MICWECWDKQAVVKQFSIFASNLSNLHKNPSKGADLHSPLQAVRSSPAITTMVGLMALLNLQKKYLTIT